MLKRPRDSFFSDFSAGNCWIRFVVVVVIAVVVIAIAIIVAETAAGLDANVAQSLLLLLFLRVSRNGCSLDNFYRARVLYQSQLR